MPSMCIVLGTWYLAVKKMLTFVVDFTVSWGERGEKINGKLCGTLEGFKDLITVAVLNSVSRADILEKVTFKQRLEGDE